MAPAVFYDSNGVIALLHKADVHHERAVELAQQFIADKRQRIITTAVLAELGDGFARKGRWKVIAEFIAAVMDDETTTIVPVDIGLLRRACELRNNRPDKDWGLTDGISFVVMSDERIQEAFTADRHFQQAGFRALLLE